MREDSTSWTQEFFCKSGPEKLSNIKIKVSSIKNLKILIRITFRTTMKKYFHNFIVKKINSR